MKTVIQRVSEASVRVDGEIVGAISAGLLILLGVGIGDTEAEAKWLADKIAVLRVFPPAGNPHGRFDRSLLDTGGGALVVSQFTLYADATGGRRPSLIRAAPPEQAAPLVTKFVTYLGAAGVGHVATGVFGAMMAVSLVNDGPVTILLDRDPVS
jgi:D-aminoacyl-tRNA deacylase